MISAGCNFFREITIRIFSSLEIEIALHNTFLHLQEYLPVEEVSLTYFDWKMETINYVACADDKGGHDMQMVPMPLTAALREWVKKDIPVQNCYVMNRPDENPLASLVTEFRKLDPVCSFLVLRLNMGGTHLGSFNLYCSGFDRYHSEHVQMMSSIREPLSAAMAHCQRYREVIRLKELSDEDNTFLKSELTRHSNHNIVGADFGLKEVMTRVRRVAELDSIVLLKGETGTGKEVIANAIHMLSARQKGPFVTVNCGAIPETLIDSELFGYEKGAFTGAVGGMKGRFERANGGTLFLDEIGELPVNVQSRLLRVLQEREIDRVGGRAPIKVDIRIIAATHRNLEEMVANRAFRQDLLFRLTVFPILIPPLRQRRSDIPALAQYFVQKKCREMGIKSAPDISSSAVERMMAYEWPGNVRELENLVERDLILDRQGPLQLFELGETAGLEWCQPESGNALEPRSGEFAPLDMVIATHIREALSRCKGQVEGSAGAAKILGLKPNTLRARMRKLGIAFGRSTQKTLENN